MSTTRRTKQERLDSPDEYYTQPGLARSAVARMVADGWIREMSETRFMEPSCGKFAWVNALIGLGAVDSNIWANDINLDVELASRSGNMICTRFDALRIQVGAFPNGGRPDCILGNPPFGDAGSHIEAALNLVSPMGIVAFLLPTIWFTARGTDSARTRWLLTDAKPRHRYMITPRAQFKTTGQDSAAYEVCIWAPGAGVGTTSSILDWYEEREVDRVSKRSRHIGT